MCPLVISTIGLVVANRYVRAMVRAEWMMWVFAAEKNVKVWIAQSLWASYQAELENVLKQSLESLQRAQQAGKPTLLAV